MRAGGAGGRTCRTCERASTSDMIASLKSASLRTAVVPRNVVVEGGSGMRASTLPCESREGGRRRAGRSESCVREAKKKSSSEEAAKLALEEPGGPAHTPSVAFQQRRVRHNNSRRFSSAATPGTKCRPVWNLSDPAGILSVVVPSTFLLGL
eukprot:3070783-Rhodomonas_salina.1